MNQICQLQCTESNAFYIGETCRSFLTVWMDTASPPQFRTQTCQLPFTPNPTRTLSRNAGLLVSYTNCQTPSLTTFAASLKLHNNSSSNHVAPPVSTSVNPPLSPSPQRHMQSLVSLSTLRMKKAKVFRQKLLLRFLTINFLRAWRREPCCLGKCCSVSPIIFITYL